MTAEELNTEFGSENVKFINGPGGLICVSIKNDFACAEISLMGAHAMTYVKTGEAPLLWMSPASAFAEGKPIRGGIPVCFPWFADHPADKSLPLHGFVRNRYWNFVSAEDLDDGSTRVSMTVSDDDVMRTLWPFSFRCTACFTVGASLAVELMIENTDSRNFVFTAALHTYLFAGLSSDISIRGLSGKEYLDKTDGFRKKTQDGDILISSETNRIYMDTRSDISVEDEILNRVVLVEKSGSATTVIWNPWLKCLNMPDMSAVSYQNMVCVEAVNWGDDSVELAPGETHTIGTVISSYRNR
jgi:glucose-6-phosphate 1-epimerase